MHGLWKAHRLGKKTRIQSTTILCFLLFSFFPPVSPSLDSRRSNTQKWKLGTDTVPRETFYFWFKEWESGVLMLRGREILVFLLLSPFSHTLAPRQSCQCQDGHSDCGAIGACMCKNFEGGEPSSLIRGAVVLRWLGKLCCFSSLSSHHSALDAGAAVQSMWQSR